MITAALIMGLAVSDRVARRLIDPYDPDRPVPVMGDGLASGRV
jgi:hypothetical protein